MTKIYSLSTVDNPDYIVYIGKTTKPLLNRLSAHKSAAKSNLKNDKNVTKVQRWILKQERLGIKILINLIDEVEDSEWEFYERYYIKLFKSFGANLKNIKPGGGYNPDFDGNKNPGFNKRGENSPSFNTQRIPKESIVLPSNSRFRKKIAMFNYKTGEILKTFDGVKQASYFIGCPATGILAVCSNKPGNHTYYGYGWKYIERDKTIQQIDINGNIVNKYDVYLNAAKGVDSTDQKAIWRAVKIGHIYRNYYWKKEDTI